jgi:Fe-S cluster biogenesis protein NfuA
MTAMDRDEIAAGVDELARMLRADGGDLVLVEADAKRARIRVRLVLDDVSCEDCVLPPDALYETIEQSLSRRVRGEFELVLDDPRS